MGFHKLFLYVLIYILFPKHRILVYSQDTLPGLKAGENTVVTLAPSSKKFPELNEGIIADLHKIFTDQQKGKHHLILDIEWDFSTLSFDYSRKDNVVTFTAKPNYVFRLVKQNSRVLWESSSPTEDSNKVVYVINDKVTIYKLDGSSVEIKLQLLSINIKKKHSDDFVKHESDIWDETHTYTSQDPFLISSVRKGHKLLWTASNGDYAKAIITKPAKDGQTVLEVLYPKDEDGEVVQGLTLKDSGDFTEEYTFHFSGELTCAYIKYNGKRVWNCQKLEPQQYVQLEKTRKGIRLGVGAGIQVEIHTLGSEKPNDERMYNFRKVSDSEGHYIFNKNVKCTKVKMNGRTVWRHNRRDYGATYPKAVSYYGPEEVHLTFSDFLLFLNKEDGPWDSLFYDYYEENSGEGEGLDPNASTDPNQQAQEDPNQTDPNQQPEANESEDPNLDQTDPDQAPANESEDPNSQVSTENNNNNNAIKISSSISLHNLNNNNSTGTSSDQDSSSFSPSTNDTDATTSSTPTTALKAIQLDIKKKESTGTFDCLKADGNARYTAKSGYGFASVKRSSSCCSSSDADLWDTKDSKNYANIVYRDGTGAVSSMNNVTIFFPNKTYKHFTKLKKKWVQLRNFELYSSGSNEELDEDKYELHKSGEDLLYKLKEGSRCTEFKYIDRKPDPSKPTQLVTSNLTVWKVDSTKHQDKYPILLSYYCPDVFVANFDDMLHIMKRKDDGKWEQTNSFDFQMFTKDSSGGSSHKVLDFKKYEVIEVGNEFHLKFASDANCSQLKHNGSELWKHDSSKHGDKYPLLLRYTKDGSSLVMDFGVSFVLCNKEGGDKLKSHDILIKLYTKASDGTLREIDYTEYNFADQSDELQFLFDKNVVCDEIKFKGDTVWSFDASKNGPQHPLMVRYKKDASRLTVNFEHTFILFERETNNNWNSLDFDVRFYERDAENRNKFNQFYGNSYDVSEDGDDYVFRFKEGIKCSVIKLAFGNLWTHSDSRFGGNFPTLVRYNRIKTKLVVNFDHMFIVYLKGDNDKWEEPKPYNIKLYGYDSSDPNASAATAVDLFDNKYSFDDDMLEFKFLFNQDVKCTRVKMDSQELWTHDANKHSGKHPLLVRYTKDGLKLLITFDDFYLSFTKASDGVWTQKESITLEIPITTKTVPIPQPYTLSLKHTNTQAESDSESTSAGSDSDSANPESTDSPPSTESQPADEASQQSQPLTKTITVLEDAVPQSDYFTFSTFKYFNTYIAKDQYLFRSVKLGDKVVYQPMDAYESAFKVLAYKDQNGEVRCIDVFMLNGSIKRFSKMDYSDEWYQKLTPLSLDIKMSAPSYYYERLSSANVQTFFSRDNFGFRKVRFGMKKVWQSSDQNGYSHKVDVKEFANHTEVKIHLFNGETKEFTVKKAEFTQLDLAPKPPQIGSDGKPVLPKLPGGKSPSEMEIQSPMNISLYKVQEPSQSSVTPPPAPKIELVEIDIDKKESNAQVEYVRRDDKNADVFKAKQNHLISRATKGTQEMWKAENDKNAIIIVVKVDSNNKTQCTPIFPRTDPATPPAQTTTPGLFDLDVRIRKNTHEYTFSHNSEKKLDSFVCRPGFKVRNVKKSNDILWETRDNRNPVHVDIYYIPVTEKAETSPEADQPKPKPTYKLGVVVYFQDRSKYMCLKDDSTSDEQSIPPAESSPKPQPAQDKAPAKQVQQQAEQPDKTQPSSQPAGQPAKQLDSKTGSSSASPAAESPDGSEAGSPPKPPAKSPDASSTESKTGAQSQPSSQSQPADQSSTQPSDSTKTGPTSTEDASSTPADSSSKSEGGNDNDDSQEQEEDEGEEEETSEESSDDQSSGGTSSVFVLDQKASQPESSTPSHSSQTARSSFPASRSSSSSSRNNNNSSVTQPVSLDPSLSASSLVSGTTATTPSSQASSSSTSTIVSGSSTSNTTIITGSVSTSTTIVTSSSSSEVTLPSGQSESASTPVSGTPTSHDSKPSAQSTPSARTSSSSTQRQMTAAQQAAAHAPVTYADADSDAEPEEPKETQPKQQPPQQPAGSAQQAKPASQARTSGTASQSSGRPTGVSCSSRPPGRIGLASQTRSGSQHTQARSGTQSAGRTQTGGTTVVNLKTGEQKSVDSGGTQPKTGTQAGGTAGGQAARTGSSSQASTPKPQAGSGTGQSSTTPPRTGTQSAGAQASRTGTANQSSRTGSGSTSPPSSGGGSQARTGSGNNESSGSGPTSGGQSGGTAGQQSRQSSGGSQPAKPAGGSSSTSGGQGTTPAQQPENSSAKSSGESQDGQSPKTATPPSGGSTGTGSSDADDSISVTVGAQGAGSPSSHATRTSGMPSSSISISSSSSGTSGPGITVQIPD